MGIASIGVALLAGALAGPDEPDAPDPDTLVRQLGSASYSVRQEAAALLEVLGRPALAALTRAREADDPEVRARASALAEAIQKRVLIDATSVTLDFTDASLAEIARVLGDRAGMPILLVPDNQPIWQTQRATLLSESPVPFWSALDRLCAAADLQVQASPSGAFGASATSLGSIRLVQGRLAPLPTSDQGPFRTTLTKVQHHREIDFVRPLPPKLPQAEPGAIPEPTVIDQFQFSIQVLAEPRLLLSQSGPLQVLQATDDRGRSLAPSDANLNILPGNPYFGMTTPMNGLQIAASLTSPAPGTQTLRVLRGIVPVSVATPTPDPLVVPLLDAPGKTYQAEGIELSIDAVQFDPNVQRRTIDLTLKTDRPGLPDDDDPFSLSNARSPYTIQTRFDVVDAQGRPYRLVPSRSEVTDPQTIRLTLALMPLGDLGEPVEIRYYDLVTTRTEIQFEFRDVPVP